MLAHLVNHANALLAQHASKKKTPTERPAIAIGLSGGPDSVFLFHLFRLLHEQGACSLIVAHFNHGWPATADEEERFCHALATTHGIPFAVGRAHNFPVAKRHQGSQEAIGHRQRRAFFRELVDHHRIDLIALGHHREDQLESFFIRLARGTSLNGIHGMRPLEGPFIRPLLETSKRDIVSFLLKNNVAYLIDPTNDEKVHLRNRVRTQLLPALNACDVRFADNILHAMDRLREEDDFLEKLATTSFEQLFFIDDSGKRSASLSAMLALDPVVRRRVILTWLIAEQVAFTPSHGLFDEIIRFLKTPHGGTHSFSEHHHIVKKSSRVWLEKSLPTNPKVGSLPNE